MSETAGYRANIRGPDRRGLVVIPLIAGGGALALMEHEMARNAFGTLVALGCTGALVVASHRARLATGRSARGQQLLFGGSVLLAAVLVWRLVVILMATMHSPRMPLDTSVHARTYLFTLVTLLLQSLGFVLWHAVLMLDIDWFKSINDRHGHLVGDAVLREVAHRLQGRLRGSDLIARFGGEEFLVLADDTDDHGVRTLAEQLRHAIAVEPVRVNGIAVPVTVSVGVHATPPESTGVTMDSLIAASDAALYAAKSAGRNCVV